jgi:hypothetical protein
MSLLFESVGKVSPFPSCTDPWGEFDFISPADATDKVESDSSSLELSSSSPVCNGFSTGAENDLF